MKETTLNLFNHAKPFLRWAGGKTWLTKHLKKVRELEFNNYHEPFLGGAATFFYLNPKNHSYLSDLNVELIKTYEAIKNDVDGVIKRLGKFQNNEKSYYEIRSVRFDDSLDIAARFIYLNQTSFNGIHRVNLNGIYNVPYGFRKKDFIDAGALRIASLALSNATFFKGDFNLVLNNLQATDLVFLDPPYTVAHNNNGFIKYNEKIFSLDDQYRLSVLIDEIKNRGAYYVLTNAAHLTIKDIFEKGDFMIELSRANAIGGANAKRGQTTEFIFTNIDL